MLRLSVQVQQAMGELVERIADIKESFERARQSVATDLARLQQDEQQHAELMAQPLPELPEGLGEVRCSVVVDGGLPRKGAQLGVAGGSTCCCSKPRRCLAARTRRPCAAPAAVALQEELRAALAAAAAATREGEYSMAAELVGGRAAPGRASRWVPAERPLTQRMGAWGEVLHCTAPVEALQCETCGALLQAAAQELEAAAAYEEAEMEALKARVRAGPGCSA